MMRLKDRRVLITGAASGIGLASAELFLQEGARVLAVDRDAAALEIAGVRLDPLGESAACTADVTVETQLREAVGLAVRRFGGLDGVVNAAGMDLQRPFAELGAEDWSRVLATNLTGPALVCMAALPALRAAGGGTIVNISSGAGLRPLEARSAYCTAKAGLVMLSKALALDLAPYGIRVNALCPGIIDTPMFRASYEHAPDPQAELARIMERFVIRRVGRPIDIARGALYLSSEESAYVTGTTLAIDGGRAFH